MADIVRRTHRVRYIRHIYAFDRRVFRDRHNPLEYLGEAEVRERYRFYPGTVHYICQIVDLERPTGRSNPLPPLLTILVALHFLATNAHHIVTASLHGVSRASVSRAVGQFVESLCRRVGEFVIFPEDELRQIQTEFFSIAEFPNVVGAIDCTHIKLQAPVEHEGDFVNRKGFHSINVQMICDARLRFLDVVAKWPGSVHDSRIFRDSNICGRFERGELDGLLVGDSGYQCRKYLMTPYQNPQTPSQARFNASLCKTRVVIEQSFGILKRRFPCLSYGLRVNPRKATRIAASCVALHNIGIVRSDIYGRDCHVLNEQADVEVEVYQGPATGSHYRDYLTEAWFSQNR